MLRGNLACLTTGYHDPKVTTLTNLAKALGVNVTRLLEVLSKRTRGRPMGAVLLATAAGPMVGLLFYGLLVTAPTVAYILSVLAAATVTGRAAVECLICDWTDRGGNAPLVRPPPPSPSGKPGGPRVGQGGLVRAPVRPVEVIGAEVRYSSPFFRRSPTQ